MAEQELTFNELRVIYADLIASQLGRHLGPLVRDKFNEVSIRNGFEERL